MSWIRRENPQSYEKWRNKHTQEYDKPWPKEWKNVEVLDLNTHIGREELKELHKWLEGEKKNQKKSDIRPQDTVQLSGKSRCEEENLRQLEELKKFARA